ncbi:PLP-dependent aminotransferase family protein [Robbsia sp. Bb-Pol-6]|uniref:PLP-dependent aminotransferase family protein n=1 Tax=Robbsia betulipollinis TaxID=2981849 RepID=A0ABT3ZTG2_9BURK|nr:PLP-dependent aminotransferase family protein [Robbsia betulipollinis]MCY0389845.1 PLP-dependent aminotransferase family protein [Robbsia betulipollinis]
MATLSLAEFQAGMTDETIPPIRAATRVEQVMLAVRQRIASRELGAGTKVPSIRSFAHTLQVSTSTVVEAYERLAAEGVIQARRGSGFYVGGHASRLSLAGLAGSGARRDRAVDPLWISRQSLDAGDAVLKPGCGWLPAAWMPEPAVRRALRALARAPGASLTDYGTALGMPALRQLLARRVAEHGIEAAPDQILLTESGTQAIDLLCRLLVEPGDTVLVDDPCYFNFVALLRAHRVRVVSVPFTPTGPDLARFEQALAEHRPRLYVTNSALHNPTGATLSPLVAHRVLKLAEQTGLTIVEDDIYGDFEHDAAPRLAAFDGLERVVHIGSFSKSLSAATRCGYVVARREWIEGLIDLKIATSFGGGRLSAEIVHGVLKDGSYRRHMAALRGRLAQAMAETRARLKPLGIVPWVEPRGGMFVWAALPDGLDATAVAGCALAEDVVLAPGNAFSVAQTARSFLRFNVSQSADDRVIRVLDAAMRSARRSGNQK